MYIGNEGQNNKFTNLIIYFIIKDFKLEKYKNGNYGKKYKIFNNKFNFWSQTCYQSNLKFINSIILIICWFSTDSIWIIKGSSFINDRFYTEKYFIKWTNIKKIKFKEKEI